MYLAQPRDAFFPTVLHVMWLSVLHLTVCNVTVSDAGGLHFATLGWHGWQP